MAGIIGRNLKPRTDFIFRLKLVECVPSSTFPFVRFATPASNSSRELWFLRWKVDNMTGSSVGSADRTQTNDIHHSLTQIHLNPTQLVCCSIVFRSGYEYNLESSLVFDGIEYFMSHLASTSLLWLLIQVFDMPFVTTVIYIFQETIVPHEQHTFTQLNLSQCMSNSREISRAMLSMAWKNKNSTRTFLHAIQSDNVRSGGRRMGTNSQIVTV